MPTVLRVDGLRVVVYPNDHRPAHVYVIGGGAEAVFDLNCPDGPSSLRESFGLSTRDATRIGRLLDADLSGLCVAWRAIHGRY